ncbi:AbrB/MazE/SpoVT family DNA-binding domain-containing protein [Thermaerobacter subterraneus]|uniref:AbrB/MazE/SpoVT family DNA-binding domain-containing protein n=1 Tax=Thermaerobacter subterraneus TaxID=175696 RepID=UPI0003047C08|nr:AbrB/MazE/SpoVT family DNA-binding domain-containing protein [Thermaerobacter subterraneus]
MAVARMTEKGQVTIPGEIRERLGIREGDAVLFEQVGQTVTMIPIKRRNPLELIGILPSTRPYPGTDAIRREVRAQLVSATGLDEAPHE